MEDSLALLGANGLSRNLEIVTCPVAGKIGPHESARVPGYRLDA